MTVLNYPLNRFDKSPLRKLIECFNNVPEEDAIQRIYLLQQMNYLLHEMSLNPALFAWINQSPDEKGSWLSILNSYGINPDASFFLKGIQFAQAIAQITKKKVTPTEDNIYPLLQERDELLKKKVPFAECEERFVALSCGIQSIAETREKFNTKIKHSERILRKAQGKIKAIKGHTYQQEEEYQTQELGKKQINNHNLVLWIKSWPVKFILRVEQRPNLGLEQSLHSYPVSDYFSDDSAVFMMQFLNETANIEYRPVVLSQLAEQGNLRDVAKKLQHKSLSTVLGATKHYFTRINDFCLLLKQANAYHPDIKLSNFLVHKNKIIVSDRKTFLDNPNPKAAEVFSTRKYAPPEYTQCLHNEIDSYLPEAYERVIDIEQFMSYQVGMALKEFLALTQTDKIPPSFWLVDDVTSYFRETNGQLDNYSLLIQELTRAESGKRLSIAHFQALIPYLIQKPEYFFNEIEKILPTSSLGIEELSTMQQILEDTSLSGHMLLSRITPILNRLSEQMPSEGRYKVFAEKLAIKCYKNHSIHYFTRCSQAVETALLTSDWEKASWYKKIIHRLSMGYFRVNRVTKANELRIDFQNPSFQAHYPLLQFLPESLLNHLGHIEASNLKHFLQTNIKAHYATQLRELLHPQSPSGTEQSSNTTLQTPSKTPSKDSKLLLDASDSEFHTFVINDALSDNKSDRGFVPLLEQLSFFGGSSKTPERVVDVIRKGDSSPTESFMFPASPSEF